MTKTYLVTGSSGFIGSHVADFIESKGEKVIRMDVKGDADIVSDIREIDWKTFDFSKIFGVIHLAAKISVAESFEKPEIYHDTNVESTRRLFASCVDGGVPRIAFASSAAVYGDAEGPIMKIGYEGAPLSPYAKSKLEGERIARELSTSETKITCFRFFNVYGPGQSHMGQYASVIPIFINKLIEGKEVTIYGSGEQTRDFIHVDDICKALFDSFFVDLEPFSIYNLGSGSSLSIKSLYHAMAEIFAKYSIQVGVPIHTIAREGDIQHSVADISETLKKFPDLISTPLKEGLGDLVGKILDAREMV